MKTNNLKKLKSLGLLFCSLVLCLCVLGMVFTTTKTFADETEPNSITIDQLTSFSTDETVEVRTNGKTGIRFTAGLSQEEYNGLVAQYGEGNFELGMAIARVGSIDALKAKIAEFTANPIENKNIFFEMTTWDSSNNPDLGSTKYEYNFVIMDMSESNYNVQYTALGYVKAGDEIAYATGGATRTLLQAASKYYLMTDDEAELTYFEGIINAATSATGATLALDKATYEIEAGKPLSISATLNGNPVTPIYSVADAEVAEVVNNVVIGKKAGTTTITATLGSLTAQATVDFGKIAIEPALENHSLKIETNGEAGTITLYSADKSAQKTSWDFDADTTSFDIRDSIVSWRETNSVSADESYVAVVESESYMGEYATEKFVAIDSGSEFITGATSTYSGLAQSKGNYFYLTSDIDVSAGAAKNTSSYNQTNMTVFNEWNFDGRGYTIRLTHIQSASITSSYTGLFGYIGYHTYHTDGLGLSWKNVSYVANITVESGANCIGTLATEVPNVDFENCYFEVKLTNKTTSAVPFIANLGLGSTMTNCIVEMNSSTGAFDFKGAKNSGELYLDNVVIISNSGTDMFVGNKDNVKATNVYGYDTFADMFNATNGKVMNGHAQGTATDASFTYEDVADGTKCYAGWTAPWSFTETDVELMGQMVRTTREIRTTVTPVMSNHRLALNTEGEETEIVLYEDAEMSNQLAVLADATTEKTFDIRDSIVSYREENAITADAKYYVKVSSENYIGSYETETFVAVSSGSALEATGNNGQAVAYNYITNYYYLTNDIVLDADKNNGGWNQINVNVFRYTSVDGRGYTITNNYEASSTSYDYTGLAGYLGGEGKAGDLTFKNVHYKANVSLAENVKTDYLSLFAMNSGNYTFENCYFEFTVTNKSVKDVPLGNFKTGSKFVDCLFEINVSESSYKDVVIFNGGSNATISNSAIIGQDELTMNSGAKVTATGVSFFDTFAEFVASNANEAWANKWNVKVPATGDKTDVTPTFANGKLTLNVNGEVATAKLYAKADTEFATCLATTTVVESVFDVREFIVSYMETQTLAYGDYEYVVVYESDSYKGTYASEIFTPITSAADLNSVIPANNGGKNNINKYLFLTTDIDISSYAKRNTAFNQPSYAAPYTDFNLDGRGHTFSNTVDTTNDTQRYCGIAGYLGQADASVMNNWNNVHYKLDIVVGDSTTNSMANPRILFAGAITNYTFNNCYFEFNVTNNSANNVALFSSLKALTFNYCVFELNKTETSTGTGGIIMNNSELSANGGATYNNCVIIDDRTFEKDAEDKYDTTTPVILTTASTASTANPVYKYTTIADFIAGTNGIKATGSNGLTKVDSVTTKGEPIKCYTYWSRWTITGTGIALCGQTVKTIS